MSHYQKPFFMLYRHNDDGEIVGVSYFYHVLLDGQRDIYKKEVPDVLIRDAVSEPPSIEVFIPQPHE